MEGFRAGESVRETVKPLLPSFVDCCIHLHSSSLFLVPNLRKSPSNLITLNLVCADLVLLLTSAIVEAVIVFDNKNITLSAPSLPYPLSACRIHFFISIFAISASFSSIAFIALDRFYTVIISPTRSSSPLAGPSIRAVGIGSAILWVYALALACFTSFAGTVSPIVQSSMLYCTLDFQSVVWVDVAGRVLVAASILVGFFLTLLSYLRIYYEIRTVKNSLIQSSSLELQDQNDFNKNDQKFNTSTTTSASTATANHNHQGQTGGRNCSTGRSANFEKTMMRIMMEKITKAQSLLLRKALIISSMFIVTSAPMLVSFCIYIRAKRDVNPFFGALAALLLVFNR